MDPFLAAYDPSGPCRGQCFTTVRRLMLGEGDTIRGSYLIEWLTIDWQPTQGEGWTSGLNPEAIEISDETRRRIEDTLRASQRTVRVRGCYRPACVCADLQEILNSRVDTVEEIPVTEIEQRPDGTMTRTWSVVVTATTRTFKGRCKSVPLETHVRIIRPG